MPIFTNPGVEFVIDDERVVMEAGTCWYINANLTHRVTNHGDADRIHLVVDCGVNDWLRERFAAAEVSHSDNRRDPGEVRQMIELLRAMNTPAAQAILTRLERELADRPGQDASPATDVREHDSARVSKSDDPSE